MHVKLNLIWPFVLIAFWMWVVTPSKFMGTINPVITNVKMESISIPNKPHWVEVSGSFVKLRDECRPLRIDWILGNRLHPGPPVEYVWGKPEVRKEGEQIFEFWLVRAAPPNIFENQTFADVVHKCGILVKKSWIMYDPDISTEENHKNMNWRLEFPWETKSVFWN